MSMNRPGDASQLQALDRTMREHWMMFLVEGIVLLASAGLRSCFRRWPPSVSRSCLAGCSSSAESWV